MDIISSSHQIGMPEDEHVTRQLQATREAFDLECRANTARERAETFSAVPFHPMDIVRGVGYVMASGLRMGTRLYAGRLEARAQEMLENPTTYLNTPPPEKI